MPKARFQPMREENRSAALCACFPGNFFRNGLERGKSQGSKATIEQALVDVDVVGHQSPKAGPKVSQIAASVKGLKQTHAA